MKHASRLLLLLALLTLATACGEGGALGGNNGDDGTGGGKADDWSTVESMTFEEFREHVYCEPDTDVCIVEGDIPIEGGEEALRDYYEERIEGAATSLSVAQQEGVDLRWPRAQRFDLTYCVSDGFGDRQTEVVSAMGQATATWEQYAYVKFRYVPQADSDCDTNNPDILFPITVAPEFATYFARAFFPDAEGDTRQVRVNMPAFDRSSQRDSEIGRNLTLAGIMRHELGHVLGFRHEHTRPEAGSRWCYEDENYRPVTEYDANSVMHYPQCNGEGDWSLELTDRDHEGAKFFYPDYERYPMGRCEEELDAEGLVREDCAPVEHQLVELANTASYEILDDWVGLDVRAVDQIVERRESDPFQSLPELREVTYLERFGVRKLYDYLYVSGRCPDEVDEEGRPLASCLPVAHRILELANTASLEELDDAVSLDSRAAENIVAARQDHVFETLAGLWLIDYVKTRALGKMYDYLYPE
ncbi:MAG: M12 family metallopeptidase [Myxococcota bacterium]